MLHSSAYRSVVSAKHDAHSGTLGAGGRLHRPFVLPARDEHFVQMRPQNVPKLILGDQWHPSLPAADCEGVGSAALVSAGRQTRGFKNNQASMAI